jgi:hypothetical protein
VNIEDEVTARMRAIEGLGCSGDSGYESLVGRYMEDRHEYIQLGAMVAIAELGKAAAVRQLQRFFSSSNLVFRKNAAYALSFSLSPEAVEALIDALSDNDLKVRDRASKSLTELTGHTVVDVNGETASPIQLQERWPSWWRDNKDKPPLPDHKEFLCHMK